MKHTSVLRCWLAEYPTKQTILSKDQLDALQLRYPVKRYGQFPQTKCWATRDVGSKPPIKCGSLPDRHQVP